MFVAGHWTPQLIEMAGGVDVLGFAGEHSEQSTWERGRRRRSPTSSSRMPCGYDAERSRQEALGARRPAARASAPGEVVAVDASAYFSRPGPRLVDGLEMLAHVLHPDLVPEAPAQALTVEL